MTSNSYEPLRQTKWQLWYQDHFDMDCPRQLMVEGHDLVEGLKALWAHHLQETVQQDGRLGFSRFNLWWFQGQRSILVGDGKLGLMKIKRWLSRSTSDKRLPDLEVANDPLLQKLAAAHLQLLVKGQTGEAIIEAAKQSKNQVEFELRLASLTEKNF